VSKEELATVDRGRSGFGTSHFREKHIRLQTRGRRWDKQQCLAREAEPEIRTRTDRACNVATGLVKNRMDGLGTYGQTGRQAHRLNFSRNFRLAPTTLRAVDLVPSGLVPVEKGLETTLRSDKPYPSLLHPPPSAADGEDWGIRRLPSVAPSCQTWLPPAQGRWRASIRSTRPTGPLSGRSASFGPGKTDSPATRAACRFSHVKNGLCQQAPSWQGSKSRSDTPTCTDGQTISSNCSQIRFGLFSAKGTYLCQSRRAPTEGWSAT
jgi:hypothetical protein